MIRMRQLWMSGSESDWTRALARYWDYVQERNLKLERALEKLELTRIVEFDASAWYVFLRDEYFRWKYTAPNRYATTTAWLARYAREDRLLELDRIRQDLLTHEPSNALSGLSIASRIHGLGTAGASGLLALMFPESYGTVDQFAVKALLEIDDLPERERILRIKPENINLKNGALLVGIYREKARMLNEQFASPEWTPRMVDKVLWTYGR